MHAVIMYKKRVLVGAINMTLILLLLLFMSECLSSTSLDVDAASRNDTISRIKDITGFSSRHWPPRRMLGSRRYASNATAYHIDDKHNKNLIDGSSASSSNMTTFSSVSERNHIPEEDRFQADQDCSPSSKDCIHNSTTIDPRYGVEKRLVPTGPNPLHN